MKKSELKQLIREEVSQILNNQQVPSGWVEIEDVSYFNDHYEEEDKDEHIKGWEAPMEGWDDNNMDRIFIIKKHIYNFETEEYDDDPKYYVSGYVAFGDHETQGPFNSYDEAFKSAVEEMNEFKKQWDTGDGW